MADSPFHLFGIRHHGPGCARSLTQALQALQPDCLLIEGPPDGESMLGFVLDAAMAPPVALLVYNPEDAQQAAFYPFAEFSPEWQALRHGLVRGIPTRFMDLPMAHRFALDRAANAAAADQEEHAAAGPDAPAHAADYSAPLDLLGQAAGYDDGESWWNHLVEERHDSLELFAAIREAMVSLRAELPSRRGEAAQEEALREAHMRKCMRDAQKEGFTRIAVVCGAWHLPALEQLPAAKADNALLKGLAKIKVAATWVPWSYQNLAYSSGYGAGITSPAWYEHLWHSTDRAQRSQGWLARAARLFRAEQYDCSSAHIIEASRLADTLAALRGHAQPGMTELREALLSVVCMGDPTPMRLIERQLVVGERLGQIPEHAPAVPLQRDIEQWQKRLRIKPEAAPKAWDLDLRQPNDLARSHLLHRLSLLDINWGQLNKTGRSAKGSFHELWTLQWTSELSLATVEASRWGNSVEQAASAKAIDEAAQSDALPRLSALIDRVLLADLHGAIAPVTRALEDLAARSSDVAQLLAALPPLVNIVRYGNVRQTDVTMVDALLASLLPRAAIGLSAACTALDDDAASAMRGHIIAADQAVRLLDRAPLSATWQAALGRLTQLGRYHGLISGLAARLRFDAHLDETEETAQYMHQALSAGNDPAPAAAWLEGFLNQSGMVLLHDNQLWQLLADWLAGLTEEHFMRTLPLLRRTFAGFSVPERRQLGERAQHPTSGARLAAKVEWDAERAALAVPLLRQLLGLPT